MATAALRRVLLDSTAWLPRDNGQPKFDKTLVIPLAIGGLIVVVVFWIGLCYRRQLLRRRQRELMVESPASFSVPVYEAYAQHSPSSERCHTLSLGARPLGLDETYRVPPKSDEVESAGILPRLLESPELTDRRIPFQRLKFKATLSSGAHGEVWLGLYRGHQVAVKQLLRTNEHSRKDVQDFADEILLTATLSHPNIVAFVGVAGSNVDTLALVLEFCPMGDLRRFLRESGRPELGKSRLYY